MHQFNKKFSTSLVVDTNNHTPTNLDNLKRHFLTILSDDKLYNAEIKNCILSGMCIKPYQTDELKIIASHIIENDFTDTFFKNTSIDRSLLNKCILSYTQFKDCTFTHNKIRECTFKNTNFENCSFTNIDFTATYLDSCQFKNCQFLDCVFTTNQLNNNKFNDCIWWTWDKLDFDDEIALIYGIKIIAL